MRIFVIGMIFVVTLTSFLGIQGVYADCEFFENADVATSLDNCLQGSDLVNPGDGKIEGSIKQKLVYWTNQIAGFLGLIAVGAVVFGGLQMTLSGGDEESIKKAKGTVQWALLGFLAIISAGALVRIVIELMFSFT